MAESLTEYKCYVYNCDNIIQCLPSQHTETMRCPDCDAFRNNEPTNLLRGMDNPSWHYVAPPVTEEQTREYEESIRREENERRLKNAPVQPILSKIRVQPTLDPFLRRRGK